MRYSLLLASFAMVFCCSAAYADEPAQPPAPTDGLPAPPPPPEGYTAAPAPPAAPAQSVVSAPTQAPAYQVQVPVGPPPRTVYVELESDDDSARLYRFLPEGAQPVDGLGQTAVDGGWQEVCAAPCRVRLDSRFRYQIWGSGVVASNEFGIDSGRSLKIETSTTRVSTKIIGWVTFAGAGGVAVTGFALALAGQLAQEADSSTDTERDRRAYDTMKTTGLVLGVGGLAVAAIGLGMGLRPTTVTTTNEAMAQEPEARIRLTDGLSLTPAGLVF